MMIINNRLVNAFAFDKDGTLIDSERVWYEAYDHLLKAFGLGHDLATHRKQMSGSAEVCMRMLQQAHPETEFAALSMAEALELRIAAYRTVRTEVGIMPMPGAEQFLAFCHDHGMWMAVATSAHRDDTERELTELGWMKYFKAMVCGDEVVCGKPAPDIYLEAARRLSMNPCFCAAFEDSVPGLKSAHAAGMQTVFMRDTHFGIEPPPEADLVFTTFQALQEHIRVV